MLRSEKERAARTKVREDKRKTAWDALLTNLRDANPTQKIAFKERGTRHGSYFEKIDVDGTLVDVRLDEELVGDGTFRARREGRFYFTVGSYRRGANARPRAVEKKTGFDWARIAQLVEEERKRVATDATIKAERADTRTKALGELKAMYKRRLDLPHFRVIVETGGTFNVPHSGLTIAQLETVVDALAKAGALIGGDPEDDE